MKTELTNGERFEEIRRISRNPGLLGGYLLSDPHVEPSEKLEDCAVAGYVDTDSARPAEVPDLIPINPYLRKVQASSLYGTQSSRNARKINLNTIDNPNLLPDDELLDTMKNDMYRLAAIKHFMALHLNKDEFGIIERCLLRGLNIFPYIEMGFNHMQLQEIEYGLNEGLDVSIYAKPEYSPYIMSRMRYLLEIWKPATKHFQDGLTLEDVSVLHSASQNNITPEHLFAYYEKGFKADELQVILKALIYNVNNETKININDFANLKYSSHQMNEILAGLKSGVVVEYYSDPCYSAFQMAEIRKGLEEHYNITPYVTPSYTCEQMRGIRKALLSGISGQDISRYFTKIYSLDQMREIRKGLEQGVNVGLYAFANVTSIRMREIRKGLRHGVDMSNLVFKDFDRSKLRKLRKEYERQVVSRGLSKITITEKMIDTPEKNEN